jgi:hypothetical protein
MIHPQQPVSGEHQIIFLEYHEIGNLQQKKISAQPSPDAWSTHNHSPQNQQPLLA